MYNKRSAHSIASAHARVRHLLATRGRVAGVATVSDHVVARNLATVALHLITLVVKSETVRRRTTVTVAQVDFTSLDLISALCKITTDYHNLATFDKVVSARNQQQNTVRVHVTTRNTIMRQAPTWRTCCRPLLPSRT